MRSRRFRSHRPQRWRNAASSSATSATSVRFDEVLPRRRRGASSRASRLTGRPTQCTKYLDALEDLDLLSAKEMRVVFEKSEQELVPLDEHVERLTTSRNLLAARLREVEDEDLEGHCWPGAC